MLNDQTVVCRCEAVAAGRIREMARLGCMGRKCGLTVTQILASALGKPATEISASRIGSPLQPCSHGLAGGTHSPPTNPKEPTP